MRLGKIKKYAPYVFLTGDKESGTYRVFFVIPAFEGQTLEELDISHDNTRTTKISCNIEGDEPVNNSIPTHFFKRSFSWNAHFHFPDFEEGDPDVWEISPFNIKITASRGIDDNTAVVFYKDKEDRGTASSEEFIYNAPYAYLEKFEDRVIAPYILVYANGFRKRRESIVPILSTHTRKRHLSMSSLDDNTVVEPTMLWEELTVNDYEYTPWVIFSALRKGYFQFEITIPTSQNNDNNVVFADDKKKVKIRNRTADGYPFFPNE